MFSTTIPNRSIIICSKGCAPPFTKWHASHLFRRPSQPNFTTVSIPALQSPRHPSSQNRTQHITICNKQRSFSHSKARHHGQDSKRSIAMGFSDGVITTGRKLSWMKDLFYCLLVLCLSPVLIVTTHNTSEAEAEPPRSQEHITKGRTI